MINDNELCLCVPGRTDDLCPDHSKRPGVTARSKTRLEALRRGRTQWGHDGVHRGNCPGYPRTLHHHHDEFCELPTAAELLAAPAIKPERGWDLR